MKKITFVTSNQSKADQLAKFLGQPIDHQKIELVEIQSLDPIEITSHKVKQAYKKLKRPVIVDDVSVTFDVFGNLPGPYIKYFLQELGREKMCNLLNGFSNRQATGKVIIGYYDGKVEKFFVGEIKGQISDSPKGENGFGWDLIFVPEGYTKTRAEMDEADYEKTSPRKQALDQLLDYLK